jgi:predicted transcriptional regulator
MRYLGIRIEDDLYRRLKIIAAQRDLSLTVILRQLIEAWVTQEEKRGRASTRDRDQGAS